MNELGIHNKLRQRLSKCGPVVGVFTILFGMVYYLFFVFNSLPRDEEMIDHFQTHQDDFKELVQRYRNFEVGPDGFHTKWINESGTQSMLDRAKVRNIFYTGFAWFPNPYSLETAKAVKKARGKGSFEIFREYGALVLRLSPKGHYRATSLTYVKVWKDFTYFPEVPRIKNGELLWPINTEGQYTKRRRALSSLNQHPDNWKDYECVFRKIEPQWFIRMCNGH